MDDKVTDERLAKALENVEVWLDSIGCPTTPQTCTGEYRDDTSEWCSDCQWWQEQLSYFQELKRLRAEVREWQEFKRQAFTVADDIRADRQRYIDAIGYILGPGDNRRYEPVDGGIDG